MTKQTFNPFRINELDGGLNLKDSSSQIQDKQGIKVVNFNFEGNKLINSKGMRTKYSHSLSGTKSILVDGTDVYYTTGGKLFKNGVELVVTGTTLPDKKAYISLWFEYIFFTYDDGVTSPQYYNISSTVLTDFSGLGTPRYNIVYNGKLVFGGYGNDNIYFSKTATPTNPTDILDFSSYAGGNQSVGGDSKGVISGLKVGENGLYVFKERSVYYSNSEKDTGTTFSFIFNKITSNGSLCQNVITEVGQETIYYDGVNKSVRRLGYEQNLTTLRDSAISSEIEPLLLSLEGDQRDATASYIYPNYKLFLKSSLVGEGVNDICLVYNVDRKSWAVETNRDCSVSQKGFLGNAYNGSIYEDNVGLGLDGGTISGEYISKAYSSKDTIGYKKYGEFSLVGKMTEGMNLEAIIYVDGQEVDRMPISVEGTLGNTLGTSILGNDVLGGDRTASGLIDFHEKIEMYDSGRVITFQLIYNGIGTIEIEGAGFKWKRDLAYEKYN